MCLSLQENVSAISSVNKCSCEHELGYSKSFKASLLAQKSSKRQCNPSQIARTLETIFKDPFSKEIFKKSKEGMERNYKDTAEGTKKNLTIIPPVYQYNSKIATHEVMDSTALEAIFDTLMSNVRPEGSSITPPTYNPGDAKQIEKLLLDLKPQTAEGTVFTELALFFHSHKGLMIHGFEPGQGLKVFVDEAANQRKRMFEATNNIHNFDLLAMEKSILQANNVDMNDVTTVGKDVIDMCDRLIWVNTLTEASNQSCFSTSKIQAAIETINIPKSFSNECIEKTKGKFKRDSVPSSLGKQQIAQRQQEKKDKKSVLTPDQKKQSKIDMEVKDRFYTNDEILREVTYGIYQAESKHQSEWDFLLVLPEARAIINVEVKNNRDTNSKNTNVTKAAEQLEKHALYMARVFGDIFKEPWSFIKVAAIHPHVVNKDLVCDECKKYVLTEDHDIKAMCDEIGLFKDNRGSEKSFYSDYVDLFNRIVSFSSIIKKGVPSFTGNTFEQIGGDTSTSIGAGFTRASGPLTSSDQHPSFDKIKNMPHTAAKAMYINNDQLGLLTRRCPRRVIFLNDFGAGNVLIHKSFMT